MKLGIIGYGKMGKAIEQLALAAGHEIVLKISSSNLNELTKQNLQNCDVVIEFTNADNALQNIKLCFQAGVPVVCGSTGWLEQWDKAVAYYQENEGSFLYASNFSIGVQLFFALNQQLAKLMSPHPEYKIELTEIHHTQKKDAPSGTAITLADDIIRDIPTLKNWANEATINLETLNITSVRQDPASGTHQVKYKSVIDTIEILHTAHSRDGFAKGALLAAEYIKNKKGIFNMKQVLGI